MVSSRRSHHGHHSSALHSGAILPISSDRRIGMANIPGAVTDPSRVRGENIELKSGGDTITGYLARPSQSGNHPGIVVIHEAFGLVEHIRDIARRFANIGYDALAPDLYVRAGGPSDPGDMA